MLCRLDILVRECGKNLGNRRNVRQKQSLNQAGRKNLMSPAFNREPVKALKATKHKVKSTSHLVKGTTQRVSTLPPHDRGYALEKFLYDIFDAYRFNPRPSFRIVGEQIDGSIEFGHEVYLIEAKWQNVSRIYSGRRSRFM